MANVVFKAVAEAGEGLATKVVSRDFEITLDEPAELGGTDTGMNPVEALLASLAACKSIVVRALSGNTGSNSSQSGSKLKAIWILMVFSGKTRRRKSASRRSAHIFLLKPTIRMKKLSATSTLSSATALSRTP